MHFSRYLLTEEASPSPQVTPVFITLSAVVFVDSILLHKKDEKVHLSGISVSLKVLRISKKRIFLKKFITE